MDSSSSPVTSPLRRLVRFARLPLERFLRVEAASGIVLLFAAAVALAWANGPFAESYLHLRHREVGVRLGAWSFVRPLEWFVNDGLMTLFFFLVGLEIRREVHEGELSEARRAVLPVAAALGGMVAPALFYLQFAGGAATRAGWGVPMATDIAFAVGVLALLGKRVPPALRVLLLALAVIDDLGAIVVIAAFYSSGIRLGGLAVAALGAVCILLLQRLRVRAKLAYVPAALAVWAGTYASGVHPTIAGVVVGAMTPVHGTEGEPSPSEELIEGLHPWAAYAIMPLFALANAGVALAPEGFAPHALPAALGVFVGLVAGKPLGVLAASALALRTGLAALPLGLRARHLLVLGLVAGIGFTMSLFVAQLAFTVPATLAAAKLAILAASATAGVLALAAGRVLLPSQAESGAATSADEAEASTEL